MQSYAILLTSMAVWTHGLHVQVATQRSSAPVVGGAREHIVGHPQLLQPPKPLEVAAVDDLDALGAQPEVAVDGVVDDLAPAGTGVQLGPVGRCGKCARGIARGGALWQQSFG